jgi:hypothetical protein
MGKEMRGKGQEIISEEFLEARCWWLMPVVLAIQEAEIRRISVQSQPQTNSPRDPISKKYLTQKRAGRVAQGVGSEFKLKYLKKKKFLEAKDRAQTQEDWMAVGSGKSKVKKCAFVQASRSKYHRLGNL